MGANLANKKERESIMPDATYQIVTLKRAVARHGVVCRMRTDRGSLRVELFWKPPRVRRAMRPFMSAMPLALIKDLAGKGFAPVNDVPIDGLFKSGIVAASFASDAHDAAELARSIIESHGLAKSDRVVAWAPSAGADRQRGQTKAPGRLDCGSRIALAQSGPPLLNGDSAPDGQMLGNRTAAIEHGEQRP
jgi:hypothetical protein